MVVCLSEYLLQQEEKRFLILLYYTYLFSYFSFQILKVLNVQSNTLYPALTSSVQTCVKPLSVSVLTGFMDEKYSHK